LRRHGAPLRSLFFIAPRLAVLAHIVGRVIARYPTDMKRTPVALA
jgi:hypothetical protein